jgi:enediyne biosynthesis protein E4
MCHTNQMPAFLLRNIFFFLIVIFLLSCNREDKLFESLPASSTNISFTNSLEKKKAFGILYYLYYYNGGGVAVGDINNDGLTDVYFSANSLGNNKLYLNKGNFEFEDITEKAGVTGTADWCTGVTMADVNADGYLDIYVCSVNNAHGLQGANQLYLNNRNNTFTESAVLYGLNFSGFSTQAAFFDYDHDGDLDCYLLNQSHKPNENIVDTGKRRKVDPLAGDRLFRNELSAGEKKFTDISSQAGIYQSNLGYGLGLAIADLNNDGWEDIFVGNDFHENDYYYVNNGNGTFRESGADHFRHYSRFSMGNDAADYNNDGQLDVITVDMLPGDEKVLKTYGSDENADIYHHKIIRNGFQYQYSKNCLQRNNGDGTSFSEVALEAGVSATDWSWSPLFADFDNDGKKDLFVSSGIVKRPVDLDYVRFISDLYLQRAMNTTDKYDEMALEKMPDGKSYPFFFKGNLEGRFEDMSEMWGTSEIKGYFNGAAYADLDNDGDLDLLVNAIDAPALVLRNNAATKHFVSVSFKGNNGNSFGIGCKTYVFAAGKMQYQQLMLTRGFQSSSDSRLHFGLDTASKIDSILVVWPDQRFQLIKQPQADKRLTVFHKDAAGSFVHENWFKKQGSIIQPVENGFTRNWKHNENDFFDYNVQYLIPHSLSTRGPKIAVADVNKDGLQDMYTCGGMGQAGALMLQQKDGRFVAVDTSIFGADAACEDVDALFFDANGDQHPDLYVVSGGNQPVKDPSLLTDRLYINDGKGHFIKSEKSLPAIAANKSCVTAGDIDKDGDNDVFVGNLADPLAYGKPQTSFLLINDGKGSYSLAGNNIIPLVNLGMVTSSSFADINKDSWPDLVVSGEWMPLTIFLNAKGRFEKTEVKGSSGWWQTIFVDDVNNDGHRDILAGNWGWNNKFHSGKNGPVKLYVSDYDKNGHTDQLLSYTVDGKEFPFLAKDEVERALPLLKKHYLLYAEYAAVPMKEVFYGWIDTISPLIAERLGSAVFYGDGKGGFTMEELPAALQLAPIFSFEKIMTSANENLYIAGGNFFDVIPYEGRYDAQPLALFSVDKKNSISYIHQPQLLSLKGQVRDLKSFENSKKEKFVIAARNNESPVIYQVTK